MVLALGPEILVNLGYVIYAFALASKEAIRLRALLFFTSLTFLTVAILIEDRLLMAWNVLFCLISGFRMAELVLEERFLHLEPKITEIWRQTFPSFSKREFLTFWDMGSEKVYTEGSLIEQGKPITELMLLIEGQTEVTQDSHLVAKRKAGDFLGEMSFFTGKMASADVTAETPTKVRAWPHEKISALKTIEPSLFERLQETLTLVLVSKANEKGEAQ